MSERIPLSLWGGTAAGVVLAAAIAWVWSARVSFGLLAGGAWSVASLWCLVHLLDAGLGPHPSRRRAIGWLLIKFPLLYLVLFLLLIGPIRLSVLGFSLGFTLVLAAALGGLMVLSRRKASYGR